MTPKTKAKELLDKYIPYCTHTIEGLVIPVAKQCALIAVDEILSSFESFMDSRKNMRHELEIEAEQYWIAVKHEIIKL